MSIYSIGQRIYYSTVASATLQSAANWELRTGLTNKTKLVELCITQSNAAASVYGLARSATMGINPYSALNFLAEDNVTLPPSLSVGAVAWSVGPVPQTNFIRRISTAATAGVGTFLDFPRGFDIPVNSSVGLWQITTPNSMTEIFASIDE